MNRLSLSASGNRTLRVDSASPLEEARRSPGSSEFLPHYSLFSPLHYEPNYAYPLIIWLHGPRDNEHQLRRVMPLISLRNYAAIGPRGTARSPEGAPGFTWTSHSGSVSAAERAVLDCLEVAQHRFHIDPQRVFLAGYDAGGTMAFQIGLRHPSRFAGVVSLGGPFPQGRMLLSSLPQIRRLPLLITHGRDARLYPVDQLCNDLRLFHTAGLSVTVRQYPCGDELTTKMLQDLNTWLMEQVTGQKQESSAVPVMDDRN
ncbi:MAG: PHB depolymerase family esterase [Pirellulales bacterium]